MFQKLFAIILLFSCTAFINGQIASIKGMCPKVTHASGMTDWTQGLGMWYKNAQSSNPLMKIQSFNPVNITITCLSYTTFSKLCDCVGQYGPQFLIRDEYTNKSMRIPEISRHGTASVGNAANEPGFWFVEMFDTGRYPHRVIEFKDNEYMFVFICIDVFDSATHGTAQWTHDEHAILYTRARPESLSAQKKVELMNMMNAALARNNIWNVRMNWYGGLINGKKC